MIFRTLLVTFFAVVGAFAWAAPADAVSVNPPIFEFRADPGDRIEETIRVFNDRAEGHLTVRPEAVNFTAKERDETSGTPQFYPGDEVRTGRELAPWLSFAEEEVRVAPLVRYNLGFTLDVPEDAKPGSYFGAAILRTPSGAETGVGLETGTAVLIIVRVNGDVDESARLAGFSTDKDSYPALPVRFEARIENDGDVHLQPNGTVTVRNMFGGIVAVLDVNPGLRSVLPESARRYESHWGDPVDTEKPVLVRQWNDFAFGPYTAELNLVYGTGDEELTAEKSFWIVPWMTLLILFGGAAALVLLIRGFFRWYAKRVIESHRGKDDA